MDNQGHEAIKIVRILDITKPTSMLVFVYPMDNYEELRQQLGSVDYRQITPSQVRQRFAKRCSSEFLSQAI
jgi:hypothetical protein